MNWASIGHRSHVLRSLGGNYLRRLVSITTLKSISGIQLEWNNVMWQNQSTGIGATTTHYIGSLHIFKNKLELGNIINGNAQKLSIPVMF